MPNIRESKFEALSFNFHMNLFCVLTERQGCGKNNGTAPVNNGTAPNTGAGQINARAQPVQGQAPPPPPPTPQSGR